MYSNQKSQLTKIVLMKHVSEILDDNLVASIEVKTLQLEPQSTTLLTRNT